MGIEAFLGRTSGHLPPSSPLVGEGWGCGAPRAPDLAPPTPSHRWGGGAPCDHARHGPSRAPHFGKRMTC